MIDFDQAVRHWAKLAPSISFLGEIALSRSDTNKYLSDLSTRLKSDYNTATYAVPLAVLAVNCAYYHYDDSGFWKHFCASLRFDCTPQVQDRLGYIIEQYMRKIEGEDFVTRSGPFRYVGRILEQCGVSQYYMPPFTDFMKLLKGRGNFEAVSVLNFEAYKRCIPDDLPKYLNSFLRDMGGWRFVTDVASSLSQYERNLIEIDTLCSLPGYRSEFWIDFLKNYDGTSIENFSPSMNPPLPHRQQAAPPYLYWVDNPPLGPEHVEQKNIYMRPFGRIGIGNFQSITTGRYILVANIAGKVGPIQPATLELQERNHTVIDLDILKIPTPCKFELWFEPVGRNHSHKDAKQTDRWSFSLVEKIAIKVHPQQVVAPEDFLKVQIDAPSAYRLKFPFPAESFDHGKTWSLPCTSSVASGHILTESLTIPVEIPVYRDIVRVRSDSSILLNTEISQEENIVIEGWPGSKVQLFLQNDRRQQKIETGSRFGKEGNVCLNVKNNLEDALESWGESWGLLSQGTGTTKGSLLYLNLHKLLKDLPSISCYPDLFFDALPEACAQLLKHLANVSSREVLHPFDARSINKFPEQLQTIAWVLAGCKKVFDGANILNLELEPEQAVSKIPAETQKTLLWYTKAREVHNDREASELSTLLSDSIRPEAVYASPWIDMVLCEQQRISSLNTLNTSLEDQIKSWCAEVIGESRLEYTGVIANLPGGSELTQAWRDFYRQKKRHDVPFTRIYGQAEIAAQKVGIVGALARILQLAVLKESDRKELMPQIDVTDISAELLPEVQNLLGERPKNKNLLLASLLL